jgi:RNA polymerase sigma-70 factor (ECF subfamily)
MSLFGGRAKSPSGPISDLPDEELMTLYASGEATAFEELLKRHERAVFNFIARFFGDRTAAEDLMQEVFIRVIRTADRYKRKAKFRTWLFTITRNICIDRLRQLSRRSEVSLNRTVSREDGDGATFLDQLADEGKPGAAGNMVRAEFRARLQAALDELPGEQREVFVMREFGGLKFREIASVTGTSENTIKSRMRYALQTLRGHLADYEYYSFDREEEVERTAT